MDSVDISTTSINPTNNNIFIYIIIGTLILSIIYNMNSYPSKCNKCSIKRDFTN